MNYRAFDGADSLARCLIQGLFSRPPSGSLECADIRHQFLQCILVSNLFFAVRKPQTTLFPLKDLRKRDGLLPNFGREGMCC